MRIISTLPLLFIVISSCQEKNKIDVVIPPVASFFQEISSTKADYSRDNPSPIDDMLLATFGEQTGHPFSIERVLDTFHGLSDDVSSRFQDSDFHSTHKYIRFMPSNEEELWAIKKREDLIIYPYPLDCEISEGIVGINNPFLRNGFPQYWCIVNTNYPLAEVDCPFALESELWNPYESRLPDELVSAICSQLEPGFQGTIGSRGTVSYVPSGFVRYVDSVLGMKPISGMKVEAFNTWHNYSAITNSSGHFSMDGHSFSSDFRYRFKFSRSDYALRNEENTTDLEYVSYYTHSMISKFFTGEYAKYSAVFQAAEFYYYEQTDVPQPPLNGFWNACLRIHVYPDSSDSVSHVVGGFDVTDSNLWPRPILIVMGKHPSGEEMGSDDLYGTTIHELGHAMLYGMEHSLYDSIQLRVKESVACGVEYFFTLPRYPDYSMNEYSVDLYTGIAQDLCDGPKHVECFKRYYHSLDMTFAEYSEYDDEVYSYTLSDVIDAVRTCSSPQEWSYRLYNMPNHDPGEELYNAFNFWFDFNY